MTQPKPIISIIVAIASNKAIGKDNKLLWHISNDLKRFKQITAGRSVIMGKRTLESLPNGPLPKRRNIILTDQSGDHFAGCEKAESIPEALNMVKNEEEVFIIGGGSVYKQFLPLAHKLYLTIVEKDYEADTFFPEYNVNDWKLIDLIRVDDDPQNPFQYRFETFVKKGTADE
jgi:dihydrofolate reductase